MKRNASPSTRIQIQATAPAAAAIPPANRLPPGVVTRTIAPATRTTTPTDESAMMRGCRMSPSSPITTVAAIARSATNAIARPPVPVRISSVDGSFVRGPISPPLRASGPRLVSVANVANVAALTG